jgi:hypothetical protein
MHCPGYASCSIERCHAKRKGHPKATAAQRAAQLSPARAAAIHTEHCRGAEHVDVERRNTNGTLAIAEKGCRLSATCNQRWTGTSNGREQPREAWSALATKQCAPVPVKVRHGLTTRTPPAINSVPRHRSDVPLVSRKQVGNHGDARDATGDKYERENRIAASHHSHARAGADDQDES